jgi:hypothetical protein
MTVMASMPGIGSHEGDSVDGVVDAARPTLNGRCLFATGAGAASPSVDSVNASINRGGAVSHSPLGERLAAVCKQASREPTATEVDAAWEHLGLPERWPK